MCVAGAGALCAFEAYAYLVWRRKMRRFERLTPRLFAKAEIRAFVDAIIKATPGLFERLASYSHTRHIEDRASLEDALFGTSARPAHLMGARTTRLHWMYKPLIIQNGLRLLYTMGVTKMRLTGYRLRAYPTAIGDYRVWTHEVPGTKALVVFPGFGLGAVVYAKAVRLFGRTVHIVEVPNMSYDGREYPGYTSNDTLYDVVQAHLDGAPHDILAHSLGSSQAGFYINKQHLMGNEGEGQKAIICDGFVNPVDAVISQVFPFVRLSHFDEFAHRGVSRLEFAAFVGVVIYDSNFTIYTKRFQTLYDTILWRKGYRTQVKYVYGERDFLYDVAYIKDHSEGEVVVIPKGRHGSCLHGKRRGDTIKAMVEWFQ